MTGVVRPTFFVRNDVVEYEWSVGLFNSLTKTNGERISSPTFEGLNTRAKWSLKLYPNGYDEENQGHVSVSLCNEMGGPFTVKYSLAIVGGDGNLHHKFNQHRQAFETGNVFGCVKFVAKSELNENWFTLLPWGKLTLCLSLQIVVGPTVLVANTIDHMPKQAVMHQFTYTWTVKRFSQLNTSPGKSIFTRAFTDPRQTATWCLQLYPNGRTEKPGKLALALVLLSQKKIKVKVTFSLVDSGGNERHSKMIDSQMFLENENSVSFGFADYLTRDKVLEQRLILMPYDDLSIRCTITYLPYSTKASPVNPFSNTLSF